MVGMDQFKDLWVQTARERVQTLNDLLLNLEKKPDELAIIDELMRAGHSLKGESGAMGYEQIASLSHVIEDLFTGIGKGEIKFNSDIMDQLLAAIDNISLSVDNIEADKPEENSKNITEKIKKLTGLKTEGFGKTDKSTSLTADAKNDKPSTTANESTDNNVNDTPNTNATNQSVALGTESSQIKDNEIKTSEDAKGGNVSVTSSQADIAKAAAPKQVSTVTLKIEKLDELLSINEELVLSKMKLKNNDIVNGNSDLKAEIHRLDRLVTDMQFYLMQARLFPISMAVQAIPRLVRDTARKTNKQVRFELEGEETTVDRTIIDHMTEAFVHMVKNCVDHGLEDTEVRKKIGKPEEGLVKIKSYTKENKFYSEVSDDGRGVEWDILLKKAIEQGKFTEEETANWTDKDKEQLLFLDGVSASEVVTDVSGRGVGLGAVKQAINKLGGSVSVSTKVGVGTTFTLRMPMTLAIMQAMLIKVGKQTFAMPSNEVLRSIQLNPDQVQSSGNTSAIVVDNSRVPLIDLAEKFEVGTIVYDSTIDSDKCEDSEANNSENINSEKTKLGKGHKSEESKVKFSDLKAIFKKFMISTLSSTTKIFNCTPRVYLNLYIS